MDRMDNSTLSFEQRPHRGIIAYHKDCILTVTHSSQHSGCDMMCATMTTEYLALNVIAVYKSPQLALMTFLELLAAALLTLPSANPCILAGDFNVDIKGINPDLVLKLALQKKTIT